MTALYLLLRHVEMAAWVAYHGAPFIGDKAALALWSMLNTAANLYRDHSGSADALRSQAASWARVDDPQAAGIARAAALAADLAAGGDARATFAAHGVDIEAMCAACPSLRARFVVPSASDTRCGACESVYGVPGKCEGHDPPDPDSAPYTLTPAAAEPLPRGPEPVEAPTVSP